VIKVVVNHMGIEKEVVKRNYDMISLGGESTTNRARDSLT
jgi:hypothetical protein